MRWWVICLFALLKFSRIIKETYFWPIISDWFDHQTPACRPSSSSYNSHSWPDSLHARQIPQFFHRRLRFHLVKVFPEHKCASVSSHGTAAVLSSCHHRLSLVAAHNIPDNSAVQCVHWVDIDTAERRYITWHCILSLSISSCRALVHVIIVHKKKASLHCILHWINDQIFFFFISFYTLTLHGKSTLSEVMVLIYPCSLWTMSVRCGTSKQFLSCKLIHMTWYLWQQINERMAVHSTYTYHSLPSLTHQCT